VGKVWAGYTRVSRVGDRGDRLISPELQAERIRAYAVIRDLEVEILEPELDVSGGSAVDSRPILSQALDGIEQGRYAGIIVAQLDRLSRMDITEALHTIRRIEAAGGEVIAVAENFDATTPEGKLGRTMILAMAEMQLDRYKAQFAAAKTNAVARGIWPLHVAPIGYTVTARKHGGDGRLHVDQDAAAKVRRAFELRSTGHSWGAIADELGGAPRRWQKVVSNRVYLGEINYAGASNRTAHEPIIDRALFEAAQLPQTAPIRKGRKGPLLGGLVRCAACRRKMSRGTDAHGGLFYRCYPRNANGRCPAPAMISEAKLNPYVVDAVLSHAGQMRYESHESYPEMDRALRALTAAESELAAYQEFTRISDVGPEQFATGMQSRMNAVEGARGEVGRLRSKRPMAVVAAGQVVELWDELDVADRSHVLRSALSGVWVRRGRGPVGPDRIRILATGFEPGDLAPAGGRHQPAPIVPFDWGDDWLEGEIRVAAMEDVA
jgi:DNA invertase Pin-like site-specific DNA recombinase